MKKRIIVLIAVLSINMALPPVTMAEDVTAVPTPAENLVEPGAAATFASVVCNTAYVPGKIGVCATSGAIWTVIMAITFGTYYKEANSLVQSACTGKWILTPTDMANINNGN